MADKSAQVNVKISQSMKSEWEDYVEETEEATSLSHLIRLAVQRKVNDEHLAPTSDAVELTSDDLDVTVETERIERRLDTIEDVVRDVSQKVDTLESGQLADEDEIRELADDLYDALPTIEYARPGVKTPTETARELVMDAKARMEHEGVTVRELAENEEFEYGLVPVFQRYFDVSEYEMQQALDVVDQYSSRVHVVDEFEYTVVFELG